MEGVLGWKEVCLYGCGRKSCRKIVDRWNFHSSQKEKKS
jgi:hypothetical protein